jgi:hypothetical protein
MGYCGSDFLPSLSPHHHPILSPTISMESNRQTQCMLNSTAFNVYWDDMAAGSATVVVGGEHHENRCAASINAWARWQCSYMERSLPLAHWYNCIENSLQ